ncbi:MAG: hypothetical protein ACE5NW_11100, partial [Acidiferrobacterales bacterium]
STAFGRQGSEVQILSPRPDRESRGYALGQPNRILIIVLVVWLLMRAIQRLVAKRPVSEVCASSHMLPCIHCGVHIPASRMVMAPYAAYGSREHMEAD